MPKFSEHELEIIKDSNTVTLRPVKPSWLSLANVDRADQDFLSYREDIVSDEGRFNL